MYSRAVPQNSKNIRERSTLSAQHRYHINPHKKIARSQPCKVLHQQIDTGWSQTRSLWFLWSYLQSGKNSSLLRIAQRMPAIWGRVNGCHSFKRNRQENYYLIFWTGQRQIQKSCDKKDALVHKRNIPKQPLRVNLQTNPRLHAPLRSLKSPSPFHIILQNPFNDQKRGPASAFLQINHHQQNHKPLPSRSQISPFLTFDARSASLPLSWQSTRRTFSVENTVLKIIGVGRCRTIGSDLRMG